MKRNMQICHWIFLRHLFFPNFAKDSWEAFAILYFNIYPICQIRIHFCISLWHFEYLRLLFSLVYFWRPRRWLIRKIKSILFLSVLPLFREKWAYDLLETVEKAFNEENSVKVYSETLTTWHFNNQQEINQKVDYLKDKYSVPPQPSYL